MIDFFTKFPASPYPLDGFAKDAANIAIGEIMVHRKVDSSYVLWKKDLLEGDTPVSVSDEIYKTTSYYWTLYYVNNVINPYTDWYMSQSEHEKYVTAKYGDKYGYHHFEIRKPGKEPRIVDDVDSATYLTLTNLPEYVFKVTNLEHEKALNDTRRVITVISPRFISEFAEEFQRIVGSR